MSFSGSRLCFSIFQTLILTLITGHALSTETPDHKALHSVQVSTLIQLPVTEAWQLLQDYSLAHNYVEGVVSTEITTEKKNGLGASRKVYFDAVRYNNETIIDWQEGQGFTMYLHVDEEPITPFDYAQFRYHLEGGNDPATTRVIMTMKYAMPWGVIGQKLNDWFIHDEMEKAIAKVAAGFKHFYETGQPANQKDRETQLQFIKIVN